MNTSDTHSIRDRLGYMGMEEFVINNICDRPIRNFAIAMMACIESLSPKEFHSLWKACEPNARESAELYYHGNMNLIQSVYLPEALIKQAFIQIEPDRLKEEFTKYAPVEAFYTFKEIITYRSFQSVFGQAIHNIICDNRGDLGYANNLMEIALQNQDIEYLDTFALRGNLDLLVEKALINEASDNQSRETRWYGEAGRIIQQKDPERFKQILENIKEDEPELYPVVCTIFSSSKKSKQQDKHVHEIDNDQ